MEFVTRFISEKGQSHELNEDSFVVHDDYVIVADGMGGESSGDIASKLAIQVISDLLNNYLAEATSEKDVRNLSVQAIKEADSNILKYVSEHPESDGMGTTVLLFIRKGDKGYITWCGDSRCYSYSGQKLHSLTKDHSYVQELIDRNEISIEESFTHPDNNLITKFVGGGEDICAPDFLSYNLSEDSTIVLCSDGLSGYCKNKDIEKVISSSKKEELSSQLFQLAIKNGSDDDITIVTLAPKKKTGSIWNRFRLRKS